MSLPIACSLTDSELQERRRGALQTILAAVLEVRELDDGFACRFPLVGDCLLELARLVELERQCCPFLRFRITAEPGENSAWLEMSGPEGAKEFIADTFRIGVLVPAAGIEPMITDAS